MGEKAYTSIGPEDEKQYLCGTNHIVIEKLVSREPAAMENSIVRRDRLTAFAEAENRIRESGLRGAAAEKISGGNDCKLLCGGLRHNKISDS